MVKLKWNKYVWNIFDIWYQYACVPKALNVNNSLRTNVQCLLCFILFWVRVRIYVSTQQCFWCDFNESYPHSLIIKLNVGQKINKLEILLSIWMVSVALQRNRNCCTLVEINSEQKCEPFYSPDCLNTRWELCTFIMNYAV